MKPRVTLRKALRSRATWCLFSRSIMASLAQHSVGSNGEPLQPHELVTFTRFTDRTTPPANRVDELWCCVGRLGGKSRAMAVLATISPASATTATSSRPEVGK
jgi:hypothetical protein